MFSPRSWLAGAMVPGCAHEKRREQTRVRALCFSEARWHCWDVLLKPLFSQELLADIYFLDLFGRSLHIRIHLQFWSYSLHLLSFFSKIAFCLPFMLFNIIYIYLQCKRQNNNDPVNMFKYVLPYQASVTLCPWFVYSSLFMHKKASR